MATRTTTVLIDDLTGAQLGGDGTTVSFALEGVNYEIDLSASSAADLREVLDPYIEAGRRIGGRKRAWTPEVSGEQAAARAWLSGRGIDAPSRGRLSSELMEQYRSRSK